MTECQAEFAKSENQAPKNSCDGVTGNMKGHGLRMKVRAMADALSEAHKAFPRIENPRLKKELRAELQRLAKAVQALTRQAR